MGDGDTPPDAPIPTAVWGTGNVGRAAIRSVLGHPDLVLSAVVVHDPAKDGKDAATLAGLDDPCGVAATTDVDAVLAGGPGAIVYAASGDFRPDDAVADVDRALRSGAVVVTPAIYALYDWRSAPAELRDRMEAACAEAGGRLFTSGIDPGWGNDVLPALLTGLAATVDSVRCQEIFDYSTYDAADAVRELVGMGGPMDQVPPMVLPTIPTMVWGGNIRLLARALGVELEDIRETLERRPLERTVTNALGTFEAGTQGALRFEIQGIVDGEPKLVIEHVTRIDPECAPDWPQPPTGAGAHRVILEGRPRIEVSIEAEDEGGSRAAGGNATAASRLVAGIPWLHAADPGLYDALDVPLTFGRGRLTRT